MKRESIAHTISSAVHPIQGLVYSANSLQPTDAKMAIKIPIKKLMMIRLIMDFYYISINR